MNIQSVISKIKQDKVLNNISSFFDNEIYLVGGSVRDSAFGFDFMDRDLIVTDIEPEVFARKIADFFEGKFIPLDVKNKIYRVVLNDKINYIDITCPIENSLKKDILRRDLTINSIAINLKTFEFIDFTGGITDLDNKILRVVTKKNIEDDPLRILRVFRFFSILGFEIEPHTLSILKKYSSLVLTPAKERIEYELMKLFSGKYAHLALLKMDECDVLEKIFPFVKELKQIPPNAHHHLDLLNHSIETVKQIQLLYEKSEKEVQEHLNKIDFGGFSRLAHLKLAGFMHDIGKFSTWTIEQETNRHRFIGHDEAGEKLSQKFLKKMNFSNKQIDYISTIVRKHIYPTSVVNSPELNSKVMMRYVRKMNDDSIDDIIIAQADRLSAQGVEITKQMVESNINKLNILLNFYLENREFLKPLPKLLDGNEVAKILNIKPSPKLGEILEKLKEAQISSEVTTKDEAIDFIKKINK